MYPTSQPFSNPNTCSSSDNDILKASFILAGNRNPQPVPSIVNAMPMTANCGGGPKLDMFSAFFLAETFGHQQIPDPTPFPPSVVSFPRSNPGANTAIFDTSYGMSAANNNSPNASIEPTVTPRTQSPKRSSKSTDKTKKPLPLDFEPSEYAIICGNKRAFFNSTGNRRFRAICQTFVEEFMTAPTKHEKSFVVTKAMRKIKTECPVGAFVAFEKGRWWEVSDRTSREKVGTFFRDNLSGSYKSSSKNKIAQRKIKRNSRNSDGIKAAALCVQAQQEELRNSVMTTASSVPTLANDEGSLGSSSASFYDVDDLLPVPL